MTMLEKAAQALEVWFKEKSKRDGDYFWSGPYGEEQVYKIGYDGHFEPADLIRAVLIGIREPDEATLKASEDQSYAISGEGDSHADVWKWMVDAILAEIE